MFNVVQTSLHTHTQLRYLSLLFSLSLLSPGVEAAPPCFFGPDSISLPVAGTAVAEAEDSGYTALRHRCQSCSSSAQLPLSIKRSEKLQENFITGPLVVNCFGNKELHTWMCRKRGFQSSGWMWYIAQWKSVSTLPSLKDGKTVSKIQPMGHSQSAHWLLYKDHFCSRQAHTKSEPVENSADYCYCNIFFKKCTYICVFIYLANSIHTSFFLLFCRIQLFLKSVSLRWQHCWLSNSFANKY